MPEKTMPDKTKVGVGLFLFSEAWFFLILSGLRLGKRARTHANRSPNIDSHTPQKVWF